MNLNNLAERIVKELKYEIGGNKLAETVLPFVFVKLMIDYPMNNIVKDHMRVYFKTIENACSLDDLFEDVDLDKIDDEAYQKILDCMDLIDVQQLLNNGRDSFGDLYEIFIKKFSDGGSAFGEYYTPQEVSKLVSEILFFENPNAVSVYDPTCGTGSMLIQAGKKFENAKLYGQELNRATYNLARMNMIILSASKLEKIS